MLLQSSLFITTPASAKQIHNLPNRIGIFSQQKEAKGLLPGAYLLE